MPRKQTTGPNRVTPTEFARRHVVYRLSSTNQAVVMVVASQADSEGRARTIQRYVAEDMGKSLPTVKRAFRWLLDPASGPVLMKLPGRRYLLVGYSAHDPYQCGHVECEADFTHRFDSDRKRAAARDRQRRRREKLRAAAEDA